VIGSGRQPVRQIGYRIHLQTDTEGDGTGETAGNHGREGPLQIKQEGPGRLEREGAGGGSEQHPGGGRIGAGQNNLGEVSTGGKVRNSEVGNSPEVEVEGAVTEKMKSTRHIHDSAKVAFLTLKQQLDPLGGQHGDGPPTHAVSAAGQAMQHLVPAAAAGRGTELADVGIQVKPFSKIVIFEFSLGGPPYVGLWRQLGPGRTPLSGALGRDEVRLGRVRRHHRTPEVKRYEQYREGN
jgi:hypothetical protein